MAVLYHDREGHIVHCISVATAFEFGESVVYNGITKTEVARRQVESEEFNKSVTIYQDISLSIPFF